MRTMWWAVVAAVVASVSGECGVNEERCPGFCFDVGCNGGLHMAAQNGQCRCRPAHIRNRRTQKCERPAPNCPVADVALNLTRPQREQRVPAAAEGSPKGFATLYSLFSSERNDHMYTPYKHEVKAAVASGYKNEGPIGLILNDTGVLLSHCDNLRPLRRFYEHQWAFDHFYTVDERQGARAMAEGYAFEGILGHCVTFAPHCGATLPLHRYWNRAIGDHIFIHKARDFEAMRERPLWTYEGIECFIWPLPSQSDTPT